MGGLSGITLVLQIACGNDAPGVIFIKRIRQKQCVLVIIGLIKTSV
jgi:hypothetical protein